MGSRDARIARASGAVCALFLAVQLIGARPSLAQTSSQDKALAEALFQQGRKAMDSGQVDEACKKFAESQRIDPSLGTLLNLATCHEQQGKTASAWAEFVEAAALASDQRQKERARYAAAKARELESRLSRLVIVLSDAPGDTVVELDGKQIGATTLATPIPIDPGEHSVRATAPGRSPWEGHVSVPAGPGSTRLEVPALKPEAPARKDTPRPPPPPPKEAPANLMPVIGIGLLGLGAVGLGVGTYFGIATFSKMDESESHCEDTRCDQEGVDLRSEARTTSTGSTIAFIAGGAAAAAGLVLVLVSPSSSPDAPSSTAWIASGVIRGGPGLSAGVRF